MIPLCKILDAVHTTINSIRLGGEERGKLEPWGLFRSWPVYNNGRENSQIVGERHKELKRVRSSHMVDRDREAGSMDRYGDRPAGRATLREEAVTVHSLVLSS
jgi:hypothetical protein